MSLETATRVKRHVARKTKQRANPWASQGIALWVWGGACDTPKYSRKSSTG